MIGGWETCFLGYLDRHEDREACICIIIQTDKQTDNIKEQINQIYINITRSKVNDIIFRCWLFTSVMASPSYSILIVHSIRLNWGKRRRGEKKEDN